MWSFCPESILTAIPQSSRRDIQPCIVSSVDISFIVLFVDWQKCGFSLNIPADLSHYLCLRVSHWVVPHWKSPSLHMRLWSTDFVSPQAQLVGITFILHPYLMQTAFVNTCLFTDSIALIGKANSQEDAPFSIAPFMSCCDSGINSPKSFSRMFWHFAFFSCRVFECRFWLLLYQWPEWSVCILFWRFPKNMSDLAHHA